MSTTLTFASTAPVGSATRPRMRPPVLCAIRRVELARQKRASRTRAFDDRIKPPRGGRIFGEPLSRNRSACTEHKPCYNRARLENLLHHCQAKNTDSMQK